MCESASRYLTESKCGERGDSGIQELGENSDFLEMKVEIKSFESTGEDATIVCMHTHANLYLEVWFTARKNKRFHIHTLQKFPLPVPRGSIRGNRCFFVLCDVVSYTHIIPTVSNKYQNHKILSKFVWKVTLDLPAHHILNAMVRFYTVHYVRSFWSYCF